MAASDLVSAVLADSPRAFWPLQDVSGDPVDISGNNLPLTTHVGIDYNFGNGPCAGSNTSVRLQGGESASRSQISAVTDNFTMEAWIKSIDVLSNGVNIFVNGTGSTNGYVFYFNTNLTLGGTCPNVGFLANGSLTAVDEVWGHVVLRRSAGTWRYFLNGSLDPTSGGTMVPIAPSGGVTRLNGSADMTAQYAFCAFYETALSDARIAAHTAAASIPVGDAANPGQIVLDSYYYRG